MTSLTHASPSEHGRPMQTRPETARPLGVAAPDSPRVGPSWAARGVVFWIAHVAYWALAYAANILLCSVFQVDDPPAFVLVEVLLCLGATAVMRAASHREPLLERTGLSKIGVITGGGLVSAVLVQAVLLATGRQFGVEPPTRPEAVARLLVTLVMIANWCGFYFGYQLVRERNSTEVRALQAEAQALRHELRHLQAQISPHFLFNALNTLQACRTDPEAIATLTRALAAYLRFLLEPAAVLEPLSRELDALEEYLTIQEVRFGDGLETRIDCDFAARGLLVPRSSWPPVLGLRRARFVPARARFVPADFGAWSIRPGPWSIRHFAVWNACTSGGFDTRCVRQRVRQRLRKRSFHDDA